MQYPFCQLTTRPAAKGRCRVLPDATWDKHLEKLATGVSCPPAHFDPAAVRVCFRGGKPEETPLPLWQAIFTHPPRHTGADLVLWGCSGDRNLTKVALGHPGRGQHVRLRHAGALRAVIFTGVEKVGALPILNPEIPDTVGQLAAHGSKQKE